MNVNAITMLALVSKYLNFLRNVRSYSDQTLRAYKNDLYQAFNSLMHENFSSPFTSEQTQLLKNHLQGALRNWAEHSPASRNRKVACLRGFCKWLMEQEILEVDFSSDL